MLLASFPMMLQYFLLFFKNYSYMFCLGDISFVKLGLCSLDMNVFLDIKQAEMIVFLSNLCLSYQVANM